MTSIELVFSFTWMLSKHTPIYLSKQIKTEQNIVCISMSCGKLA